MWIVSHTSLLHWTEHCRVKMRQYQLSAARVRRVLHSPKRVEEGIAPKTVAMMQPAGSERHPQELWVMVQKVSGVKRHGSNVFPQGQLSNVIGQKLVVISAWRYPGVTKPRSPAALALFQNALADYVFSEKKERNPELKKQLAKSKWFKPQWSAEAIAEMKKKKAEFRKKFAKTRWHKPIQKLT